MESRFDATKQTVIVGKGAVLIVAPSKLPSTDIDLICMFCAKKKFFFADEMDQVLCDPVNNKMSYCREYTTAMRCKSCRHVGRKMTFDMRIIADTKKLTMADSETIQNVKWPVKGIPLYEKSRTGMIKQTRLIS